MTQLITADVLVDGLATDGRGAARVNGVVYFISGGLPGDRLRVQLDPSSKPPSGEILALIEPSPQRVEHPCPHAGLCTASPWGWFSYEKQLEHKRALVERTLRKSIGDVLVLSTVASPKQWYYRNRISLTVWQEEGRARVGYQRTPRTYEGTPIRTCKLGAEPLDALLRSVATTFEMLDIHAVGRLPRRIQLHETALGAGMMLVFAGSVTEATAKTWTAKLRNLAVPGGIWFAQGTQAGIVAPTKSIRRTPDAQMMRASWFAQAVGIHPAGFTQANAGAANLVLARLREYAQTHTFERVWDLYGGYGALGFALAGEQHPLTVMEISVHAERAFQELGALVGNISRKFLRGDVHTILPQYAGAITAADVIVLDPTRSGAHPDVLHTINRSPAQQLIYLSCNPARFGRDLHLLQQGGFVATEIQPYDFFPQTPTIEALAILQR